MKVKIAQQTFYVTKTGQATPNWVFFHGFMGSGADFARIGAQLPGTSWYIDLLGHGQTSKVHTASAYAMVQQIQVLEQLFQQLLGHQRINLVGYSMGGRLALGYALTYPERLWNLVLESSTAGLETVQQQADRRAHDALLAQQLQTQPLVQFVNRWEQLPLFASQQQLSAQLRAQIRRQRLTQDPKALAASLVGMGTGAMPNFWPQLVQLALPVTLITGAQDTKFRKITQQMAQQLPRVQRYVVAQAGHNVHLEQPKIYRMILRSLANAT